jgi:predicted transcriptional regulator
MTDNQIKWLGWMLKGMGLNAAKKEFNAKETRQMEELIELGLVTKGQNYKGDKVGMYHVRAEDKEKVRKAIAEKQLPESNQSK